jgi:hypothetical protein
MRPGRSRKPWTSLLEVKCAPTSPNALCRRCSSKVGPRRLHHVPSSLHRAPWLHHARCARCANANLSCHHLACSLSASMPVWLLGIAGGCSALQAPNMHPHHSSGATGTPDEAGVRPWLQVPGAAIKRSSGLDAYGVDSMQLPALLGLLPELKAIDYAIWPRATVTTRLRSSTPDRPRPLESQGTARACSSWRCGWLELCRHGRRGPDWRCRWPLTRTEPEQGWQLPAILTSP